MIGWALNLGFAGSGVVVNIPQIPGAAPIPSRETTWGAIVAKAAAGESKRDVVYEFRRRKFYDGSGPYQ